MVPRPAVKLTCVIAVLVGIFALVAGCWATAICLLLGAYLFEKNLYCCPVCGKKLDMKAPVFPGARCPGCGAELRERK